MQKYNYNKKRFEYLLFEIYLQWKLDNYLAMVKHNKQK